MDTTIEDKKTLIQQQIQNIAKENNNPDEIYLNGFHCYDDSGKIMPFIYLTFGGANKLFYGGYNNTHTHFIDDVVEWLCQLPPPKGRGLYNHTTYVNK